MEQQVSNSYQLGIDFVNIGGMMFFPCSFQLQFSTPISYFMVLL